jgi:hypothetical protein
MFIGVIFKCSDSWFRKMYLLLDTTSECGRLFTAAVDVATDFSNFEDVCTNK